MISTKELLLHKYIDDPNKTMRVEDYYLPIFHWGKSLIKDSSTVLIGINGPQGSGKTTLCEALVEACRNEGIRSAALSIDDFYLTRQEQIALAAKTPDNIYLEQRGYPGTHAVSLGEEILKKIKELKKSGNVLCPQYDKSAFKGQGDRLPETRWKNISAPLDILFFEGWMLGFTPVDISNIHDAHFKKINNLLEDYKKWTGQLDAFLFLKPAQINFVIDWRVEAEEKRKAQGLPGMSTAEITSYVTKFLPAYENYLPTLEKLTQSEKPFLSFTLGKNRLPSQPIQTRH